MAMKRQQQCSGNGNEAATAMQRQCSSNSNGVATAILSWQSIAINKLLVTSEMLLSQEAMSVAGQQQWVLLRISKGQVESILYYTNLHVINLIDPVYDILINYCINVLTHFYH